MQRRIQDSSSGIRFWRSGARQENIADHGTNGPRNFLGPQKGKRKKGKNNKEERKKERKKKKERGKERKRRKRRGKYERRCKNQAKDKKF